MLDTQRTLALVAGGWLLLAGATPAQAATITFDLNCEISGHDCTTIASAGTIALTDDGNFIDIVVSLNAGTLKQFYLNFLGFPLDAGYFFETSTGTSVGVSQDSETAAAVRFFDISIPSSGNINAPTFSTTLRLTNGSVYANLDTSQFAAFSTDGELYAALLNNSGGGGWLGATSCTGCTQQADPPGPTVSEPASLLLFGTALFALMPIRRLMRRKTATGPPHAGGM